MIDFVLPLGLLYVVVFLVIADDSFPLFFFGCCLRKKKKTESPQCLGFYIEDAGVRYPAGEIADIIPPYISFLSFFDYLRCLSDLIWLRALLIFFFSF